MQAAELPTRAEDLTESQLEELLADRRLDREKRELASNSQANVISASAEQAGAVGALLYVDICIEGTLSERWWTLVRNLLLCLGLPYTQ